MLAPSADQAPTARRASPFWSANPAAAAALIVAVAGALTIAGAWFFELVIKLNPCPLCLEQRWPYYIAIPVALLIVLATWRSAPRAVVIGGLLVLAGVMLWGAGLGVYHAGIEWKWWVGPQECSGAPQLGPAGGLLQRLETINITRCDEAAWRFLGISLAGYNALIATALAIVALAGARATWKTS
jgi:disulfide bond formation protein DsbB